MAWPGQKTVARSGMVLNIQEDDGACGGREGQQALYETGDGSWLFMPLQIRWDNNDGLGTFEGVLLLCCMSSIVLYIGGWDV